MALAQFEGTLVLVSHDRHLLRATTDQFMIVADGKLQPFDGDLDDYKDWLFKTKLAARNDAAAAAPLPAASQPVAEPQRWWTARNRSAWKLSSARRCRP
jgi:ATP-binding cassette subfamily F protein 3